MAAGIGRDELLRVVDRLREETGWTCAGLDPESVHLPDGPTTPAFELRAEDERFVRALRMRLARLADAAADESTSRVEIAVAGTLDLIELVTRGEILRGNERRLWGQVPSFVFLVINAAREDQGEALALARRSSREIEELGRR